MAGVKLISVFVAVALLLETCLAIRIPFADGKGVMLFSASGSGEISLGAHDVKSFVSPPYIEFSDNCRVKEVGLDGQCDNSTCRINRCEGFAHKLCVRGWQPLSGTGVCTVMVSKTESNGTPSKSMKTWFNFRNADSDSCSYVCYNSLHPSSSNKKGVLPTPELA